MVKLLGIFIILAGVAGGIYSWLDLKKKRIANIQAVIELLTNAGYQLGRDNRKTIDFFQENNSDNETINNLCKDVHKMLVAHALPTGEDIWKCSVKKNGDALYFGRNEMKILNGLGEAFFASYGEEKLNRINTFKEQFEDILQSENKKSAEQKKLYVPLWGIGGVLLIIILI